MMRSNTSMTGPTSTCSPVSSSISRASAVSSVSPVSTVPPGRLHWPLSGSCFRLISTTLPSSTITAPTPTMGRSGYCRVSFTLLSSRFSVRVHFQCSVRRNALLAHHLHDDALSPLAIELGVEHLLPRTEIEATVGDRQHHLMTHDCAFQMCVRVVFASLVVPVVEPRRRQLLEPRLKIVNQAVLPVVHIDTCGDVHGRHEHHAFLHAAFLNNLRDVVSDADKLLPLLRVEPEVLCVESHSPQAGPSGRATSDPFGLHQINQSARLASALMS